MKSHKLLLLSPYRLPGQNSMTLGDDEMAAWLNGYTALWHPAALWQADGPPSVDAPYDYEDPKPGYVFAVPDSPPLILPDDWEERVRAAGSIVFHATADREETLANLQSAACDLAFAANTKPQAAPFFGVGLGHLLLATLCEAMEHENLLESDAFWEDVQQAIAEMAGLPFTPTKPPEPAENPSATPDPEGSPDSSSAEFGDADATQSYESENNDRPPPTSDFEEFAHNPPIESDDRPPTVSYPEPWYRHLQSAADRLLSAREVLYPVAIHLVDICLPDEKSLEQAWPLSLERDLALNVVASSSLLEQLQREQPDKLAELRQRLQSEQVEVCGGSYLEREDALLPVESQVWNLLKGQAVAKDLLGSPVRVYARRGLALYPQLPALLESTGLNRAVFLSFDDLALSQHQAPVVSWPAPNGKQVDAYSRKPHAADSAETFFNLGHYLYKTIREDHSATLALLHRGKPAAPWYRDCIELSRFANVLGQWTTFSRLLTDVAPGEYASTLSADEFQADYLSERVAGGAYRLSNEDSSQTPPATNRHSESTVPVSGFARHARVRRRIDTCWTLAALERGLAGANDSQRQEETLTELENAVEIVGPNATTGADFLTRLNEVETGSARSLAGRLLARATDDQPGYLILNPCSFLRRVVLEFERRPDAAPLPIAGAVKACQIDGDKLRVVAEVPALGFTWLPQTGPKGTLPPAMRMKLADERHVRNEFLEAEIDPATGGLRGIKDQRTGGNRIAERLVFNPGSTMKASSVKVTSVGPALGEVVTEGAILGEQEQILAKFRQRFRVWLGRPMLELRIELFPEQPPAGYPWHAYFGARFAWRDERAMLLRSVNGTGYITTHMRPQTPDYLELRYARQSTVIFPGGLPFHQRHEGRMLDIILVPEGESAQVFELGIALDRETPMQTALGLITPVAVVPTTKGPPHIGATGWLFHLDTPNLALLNMRPGGPEVEQDSGNPPRDLHDAVTLRLLECGGSNSHAELRCVRDPKRVTLLDARGGYVMEGSISGDAALFEMAPSDMTQVQIEFSQNAANASALSEPGA
jgi:hypothetical protein